MLSWSSTVSSVPFWPKKDLRSLSSYQFSDGTRSPPSSGWPHMILEKARKLSMGSAVRLSEDKRRRASFNSVKLEREENWERTEVKATFWENREEKGNKQERKYFIVSENLKKHYARTKQQQQQSEWGKKTLK